MNILQLPDDIILDILFLNANVFSSHNCLRTTLSSSQVCTRWRSLLLSTPSIWGRLMSISELEQITDTGRECILSRSKDAPLWVCGRLLGFGNIHEFIFTSILTANWERIEHLHIDNRHPPINNFGRLFERGARTLRSFHFVDDMARVHIGGMSIGFFRSLAPSLRSFSAACLPPEGSAPWMNELRHLGAYNHPFVSEVLSSLRSTFQLRSLSISELPHEEINIPSSVDELPNVLLPRLSSIHMDRTDIRDCTVLIQHIRPAKGCSLRIYPLSNYGARNAEDLLPEYAKEAVPLLSSYLKDFLQVHMDNISSVGIRLDTNTFSFECRTEREGAGADDIGFSVKIGDEDRSFSEGTYALFSTLFSTYDFSFVKELILNIPPIPSMEHLTASYLLPFSSVTHLSIHTGTFPVLLALTLAQSRHSDCPIFPLLEMLTVLTSTGQSIHPHFCAAPSAAIQFLEYRKSIGYPIQKLVCMDKESHRFIGERLGGTTEVVYISEDVIQMIMSLNIAVF